MAAVIRFCDEFDGGFGWIVDEALSTARRRIARVLASFVRARRP